MAPSSEAAVCTHSEVRHMLELLLLLSRVTGVFLVEDSRNHMESRIIKSVTLGVNVDILQYENAGFL